MRAFEDELVDHAVDTHRATDQLRLGIFGILEDEMVAIECSELLSADAARQLLVTGYMSVY